MKNTIDYDTSLVYLKIREENAGVLGKAFISHFSSIEEARKYVLASFGVDCKYCRRFGIGSPMYRGNDGIHEITIYW